MRGGRSKTVRCGGVGSLSFEDCWNGGEARGRLAREGGEISCPRLGETAWAANAAPFSSKLTTSGPHLAFLLPLPFVSNLRQQPQTHFLLRSVVAQPSTQLVSLLSRCLAVLEVGVFPEGGARVADVGFSVLVTVGLVALILLLLVLLLAKQLPAMFASEDDAVKTGLVGMFK